MSELKQEYVGVHFGDVHFGKGDPVKLFTELKDYLYSFVEQNLDSIDYVVLSGDYFEKVLGFNDQSSKLAMKFFYELLSLCVGNGIKVRAVSGTETHDFNQMDHFKIYEDDEGMFKVISTVYTEYLFPNFKVLYLPEEYPDNSEEYYSEVFAEGQTYNIIVGHGTFDFQAFACQVIESERPIPSAVVFPAKEVSEFTTGPVIFGHIHVRSNWKKKVFYHGSFSRTAQGENGPKGFCYSTVNVQDNTFSVDYVDNDDAPTYVTFEYDKLRQKYKEDEQLFSAIKTLSESYYRVRIRFAESFPNERLAEIAILRQAIVSLRNIEITTRKKTSQEETATEVETINEEGEVIVERDTRFDFLIDGTNDIFKTISDYIVLTKGVEVDPEFIRNKVTTNDNTLDD